MSTPDLRVVESAPLPYLLSVPASRGDDPAPLPLLCFLHGYDEAAPVEIRSGVARHGPLRPGSSARALEGFIVVAPQLPRAGDLWHRHAKDVREIVEQLRAAHPMDPERMYLTGFSFGGNGVFDLALLQPGTWAALWPVDPTRVPSRDPERPVWLSVGEIARRGTAAFVRALGLEPVVGEPAGDRLYLDEGQDHVGSATVAYRDDRIYDWLLSRRLG
ncbi:MAG TPA: hypothetical protein VGR37_19765 [Longimicrobiaceae bacterium]|nr:hypothetical protein [Longimicrobiaceae bacterium]